MGLYLTVGALDCAKSNAFYDAALAAIGWSAHADYPGWRVYSEGGSGEGTTLSVCAPFDGERASAGNGAMIGFLVKSRSEVDAFYEAAIENGGADDGAPGLRPHYGPSFYAAYVRDPAGNKIAVVHNP